MKTNELLVSRIIKCLNMHIEDKLDHWAWSVSLIPEVERRTVQRLIILWNLYRNKSFIKWGTQLQFKFT